MRLRAINRKAAKCPQSSQSDPLQNAGWLDKTHLRAAGRLLDAPGSSKSECNSRGCKGNPVRLFAQEVQIIAYRFVRRCSSLHSRRISSEKSISPLDNSTGLYDDAGQSHGSLPRPESKVETTVRTTLTSRRGHRGATPSAMKNMEFVFSFTVVATTEVQAASTNSPRRN